MVLYDTPEHRSPEPEKPERAREGSRAATEGQEVPSVAAGSGREAQG